MKLYMVLERFLPGCKEEVYERLQRKGRMLPEGLEYVDSWVEEEGDRCFQLMRARSPELFAIWTASWSDLVAFEIVEIGVAQLHGAAVALAIRD